MCVWSWHISDRGLFWELSFLWWCQRCFIIIWDRTLLFSFVSDKCCGGRCWMVLCSKWLSWFYCSCCSSGGSNLTILHRNMSYQNYTGRCMSQILSEGYRLLGRQIQSGRGWKWRATIAIKRAGDSDKHTHL